MSDRYKSTYRVLMIDQHFPDASFIDFSKFSAKDQIKRCLKAGVDSIHVTAKCHHGYSYYDTRIGTRHPALGKRDMFGELVQECRRKSLEAICYYCLIFEQLSVEQHPRWTMLDRQKKPMVWHRVLNVHEGPASWRWNMPCIQSPYGQYCLDQLAEIAGRYEIDGVFLDIFEMAFSSRFLCHCRHCEKYYRSKGLDLWDDSQLFELLTQKSRMWGEFLSRVRTTLDAARPGLSLSLNGGPLIVGWESLKQLSWPYTEGGEHAYNAVILKNLGVPYPQCGIVGGTFAHDDWKEAMVQIQTSTVLAHGSRCFYFFTMGRRPDFSFEQYKYDLMEKINSETAKKQPYVVDAEPCRAVAVYYSESSRIRNEIDLGSPDWMNYGSNRFERGFGRVIDAVRQTGLPCEVLPNWRCTEEELTNYQFIIIPEMDCLSDTEIDTFIQFVRRGGHLLVTGESGLRNENARERRQYPLFDFLGVKYEGLSQEYTAQGISAYVNYARHPLFGTLCELQYLVRGDVLKFTAKGAKVISRLTFPVAVETQENFIGWNPLPPAQESSNYVAFSTIKRGRGTAIFSAVPLRRLLEMGVKWPGEVLRNALRNADLSTPVTMQGPEGVEITCSRQNRRIVIHLLNQTIRSLQGSILPVEGIQLTLQQTHGTIGAVRQVWPRRKSLTTSRKKEGIMVTVPALEIHSIITAELKS